MSMKPIKWQALGIMLGLAGTLPCAHRNGHSVLGLQVWAIAI